jgi:hypothetical protein
MVVESFGLANFITGGWSLATTLARSQPLGAAVVLLLLSDLTLAGFGALIDCWESRRDRKLKQNSAARNAATPPACGAEPAP